jgi:S-methylmethionine-dependent homocysteine/selenocysteine methylase
MSSIDQARGGLMGAQVTELPVWVAFSVSDDDGRLLRSGEPLANVLPLLKEYRPEAVLINCSSPEAVSDGLSSLVGHDFKVGAYANGFTKIHADFNSINATVDLLEARTDLGPDAYLTFAKGWAATGASIVGGCCEVGPKHIETLAQYFA